MLHRPRRRALTLATLATALLTQATGARTWNADGADPAAQKRQTLERLDQVDGSGWKDLAGLLREVHERTGVPAIAAALVKDGEVVEYATVGVRAFGSDEAVGPTDAFHLGSVTKSFTALIVGKLVERGQLSWGTTVGSILTDVDMLDAYRSVTLEQLLLHRGGLPAYTHGRPAGHDPDAVYSGSPFEQRAAFLADALRQAPAAAPGEVLYSNAGYALAGHMAERASGVSWEELVRRNVFEPLDMQSAGFGFPQQPLGHAGDGPEFQPVPMEAYPAMEIIAPAGNIHASAPDLARYCVAHLAGLAGQDGIVRSETMKRLHALPQDARNGTGYASGWVITRGPGGEPVHAHGGTVGASYAEIKLYPAARCGVVVLTTVNSGIGEALANQVARALLERHRPAVPGFVSADTSQPGEDVTVLTEAPSAEDDARFWRVVRGLSEAINDEDRAAYHALFAPSYDRADGDSMFDFMAQSVLPSRGGVRSFHTPNAPFRSAGSEHTTRTVTFHLENGFPGYYGLALDAEGRIVELSLFVMGSLCPNGTDRNCPSSSRLLKDLR